AGRGGEALDADLAGGLQQALGDLDVALDVRGEAVRPRRPHTRLPGEVQHALHAVEQRDRVEGGEVALDELEARVVEHPGEVRPLQAGVVVVGEGVDAAHLVAVREQALGGVAADEPGTAGDEDVHPISVPRAPAAQRATKYLARGWWQMIAEVVCSGWYWNDVSSLHSTPMRLASRSWAIVSFPSRSGQAG